MATVDDYKNLVDIIVNRMIEVPEGLNAMQLYQWLNGYAKCQNDVIEIIMELKKGVSTNEAIK